MKPRVLVSMCLMGVGCRYDGRDKDIDLDALMEKAELIPVCPEQLGGLSTPRMPAERRGDAVVNREGIDVTAAFDRGAEQAARLARRFGAQWALLKARSPSCGVHEIYDGSFSGARIPGMGVAAARLRAMGVRLYDECHIDDLLKALGGEKNDTL